MGILSWIVLGLIAGALAKLILPGRQGGGWVVTILLGIAGAFIGGWVGSLVGLGSVDGFNLATLATAVVGAIILLLIWGAVSRSRGV